MGNWVIKNFIEISDQTNKGTLLECIHYKDIDEKFINTIVSNDTIKTIQISKELPNQAYTIIDSILERKPEFIFRIYNLYLYNQFDISFLEKMTHLKRLRIDCHLRGWNENIDFQGLTKLNLKSLHIDAFDLKDYTFIKDLSENLEELTICADTMSGSIHFDCQWLLRYKKLSKLWLGKKAKKNIECLSALKSLQSLSLRGIKLKSFAFLNNLNLEKFELLWCSNNDLDELKELKSLKEIGLWRINKLDNIDFMSELDHLEVIKLQDLRHLTQLPDLSHLKNLKTIVLDHTGILLEDIEEPYQSMVERYWI